MPSSTSATILAALVSLCLFESTTLPAGPVRRVSLLGYQLGAEVLDLEEAAARATVAPKPLRNALVRLERLAEASAEPAPNTLPGEGPSFQPPPVEEGEPTPPSSRRVAMYGHSEGPANDAPERTVDLDESRLFVDEEPPASERRPVGSDVELEAPSDPPPADLALESEIEPAPAQARLCTHCHGGKRYQALGCIRCNGFDVLVWVNDRQISTGRPPATDEERLGAVNAVSDLFSSLTDPQRRSALDLFHFLVKGGSPALRTQALAQWRLRAENEAFDRMMGEQHEGGA